MSVQKGIGVIGPYKFVHHIAQEPELAALELAGHLL